MKQSFRYEQEKDSAKKQYKQEVIEFILNEPYGTTITYEKLAKMLRYNIDDEEDYYRFKQMMSRIKSFLIKYGRVLKGISGVGYYILKPSQMAQHCYRTYIRSASKLYDKSAYVLDKTDKTKLNQDRIEEITNIMSLTHSLITNTQKTISESSYISRKDYYDSLEED